MHFTKTITKGCWSKYRYWSDTKIKISKVYLDSSVYKNLGENCDFNFRHDESGKLFKNEMDVIRSFEDQNVRIIDK